MKSGVVLAGRAGSEGFLEGQPMTERDGNKAGALHGVRGKFRVIFPGLFFNISFFVKSFLTSPVLKHPPRFGKCDVKTLNLGFDKQYNYLGRENT